MSDVGEGRAVRVVLADDSQTVRAVLRRLLEGAGFEVAGAAADGEEAVRLVLEARPDVVLLDLDMPGLDGAEATRAIMESAPRPIVILTSRADPEEFRQAARALAAGALEVVPKPATPDAWVGLQARLAELLRAAAGRPGAPIAAEGIAQGSIGAGGGPPPRLVAVGASTGGPTAVRDLLRAMGPVPPVTVLVVQHMAAGFEAGLAEWLALETGMPVRIAAAGEPVGPREVRVAPASAHLTVDAEWRLALDAESEPVGGHRPSVDALFFSCARLDPRAVVGILLTGMGQDGAAGLAALREGGGLTIAQDPSSCAVRGMPEAAIRTGAAALVLPPAEAGAAVRRLFPEGGGG